MLKILNKYKNNKEIKNADQTTIRQFKTLKESVNTQGFITRGTITNIITETKLNNYFNVKKYNNIIKDAMLQLFKFEEFMLEWLISQYFLKRLSGFY